MLDPNVPPPKPAGEPEETPVADLTRGTWIQAIDEDGCDHGEAEVLHVESYGGSAVMLYRPQGASDPRTSYFDDATNTVPVLSAERLAEAKAAAERAARIADIRRLADLLEEDPDVPLSDYPHWQINLHGADDVARVRTLAAKHGAGVVETAARTEAMLRVGDFEYCVIAWHPTGRVVVDPEPPLASGRELSAADEATPTGRREPLHTGGVVDGGQLVDETEVSDRDRAIARHGACRHGLLLLGVRPQCCPSPSEFDVRPTEPLSEASA